MQWNHYKYCLWGLKKVWLFIVECIISYNWISMGGIVYFISSAKINPLKCNTCLQCISSSPFRGILGGIRITLNFPKNNLKAIPCPHYDKFKIKDNGQEDGSCGFAGYVGWVSIANVHYLQDYISSIRQKLMSHWLLFH